MLWKALRIEIECTLEGALHFGFWHWAADDLIEPPNYTLLLLSPLFTSLRTTLGACFDILLFLFRLDCTLQSS